MFPADLHGRYGPERGAGEVKLLTVLYHGPGWDLLTKYFCLLDICILLVAFVLFPSRAEQTFEEQKISHGQLGAPLRFSSPGCLLSPPLLALLADSW